MAPTRRKDPDDESSLAPKPGTCRTSTVPYKRRPV